jgi:transposase
MISQRLHARVFVCTRPVDMRKSFDTLAHVVRTDLGRDPLSGEIFLFLSRTRRTAKALLWDGTGLCLYAKRIERARFAAPWRDDGQPVTLTASELALFFEGSTLIFRTPLSPPTKALQVLAPPPPPVR